MRTGGSVGIDMVPGLGSISYREMGEQFRRNGRKFHRSGSGTVDLIPEGRSASTKRFSVMHGPKGYRMIRTKDVSLFYIAAITMKAEAAFTAVNHLPYSCLSFSAIENLFVDADRPSGIRSTVPAM
jgi:hypothetical protein